MHSSFVIRASVNVTKYNRTLELSTPRIPFTLYDNWDARRESVRRRESERACRTFEKNKRKKERKKRRDTTVLPRENFIVVARVIDRVRLEFSFSPDDASFSHNCIVRRRSKGWIEGTSSARTTRGESSMQAARNTEKTRPDDDDDYIPTFSSLLTANKTHDQVTIEPSILSFFLSSVFRRKNGVVLGPLVNTSLRTMKY